MRKSFLPIALLLFVSVAGCRTAGVPDPGMVQVAAARDAPRMATKICNPCAASATTTYPAHPVNGGSSVIQATCSTAGGNTWPDAIDLQARDGDDHTYVAVKGYTAWVADGRETNLIGFSEGSWVRAVITDAAGSHSCFVTIAPIYSR